MTKADIIEKVASASGMTRGEVEVVFEGIFKVIAGELAAGGTIELRRFGTFKTARRAPRKAVNPRTGEPVAIEERVVPAFKPSPQLKAMITKK